MQQFFCFAVTKDDRQFLDAVKESPPSVFVAVICFFSVWSILGLAGFHTYLTTSNQTTNEDVSNIFFILLFIGMLENRRHVVNCIYILL